MHKTLRIFFLTVAFLVFICFQFSFGQNGLIQTIYFRTDSYSIDKSYKNILNDIAKQCSSETFSYMKIFAFTDTIGSEDYNDELSKKRAMTVYNYLQSHSKFDTTKVYVEWLGKSGDGYDLHFPQAHLQQRCVDIWVTFKHK